MSSDAKPVRRKQVEALLAASPPALRLAFALAAYAGLQPVAPT
jgi:hypothetical protein